MTSERGKKKKIFIFAIVAVIFLAVLISGIPSTVRLMLAKGGAVSDGVLPNVTEHINDVPDGEVKFLINKNIVFENVFSLGDVMLENPQKCKYDLKFIFYSSDGKMIYSSPLISSGQCLEKDKLSSVVKPGEYKCSYSAQAYDNGVFKGEVTGVVTVRVGE